MGYKRLCEKQKNVSFEKTKDTPTISGWGSNVITKNVNQENDLAKSCYLYVLQHTPHCSTSGSASFIEPWPRYWGHCCWGWGSLALVAPLLLLRS